MKSDIIALFTVHEADGVVLAGDVDKMIHCLTFSCFV